MSKAPEIFNGELLWAAGFFDGEGCSYLNEKYAVLSIGQADPEVLERFQKAVGKGVIIGPYPHGGNKPMWQYRASGLDSLEGMELIYPFLSSIKRAQWDAVISNPERKQPRRRGFCHNDLHEMTEENIMVNENNRCRECRNDWRKKRREHGKSSR